MTTQDCLIVFGPLLAWCFLMIGAHVWIIRETYKQDATSQSHGYRNANRRTAQ